jgi:dihydrofolate reductase
MAFSLDDALHKCDTDRENFVIGGASIYRQFLPLAGKLYVTRVMKTFEADTFFPEISSSEWIIADKEDVNDDPQNDFTYSFITYQRKNYL